MKKNNATGDTLTEKVPIKHFLLIMRTTFILLFACVFYSMAEVGYTQNARVTINKRNVALKEVLNEIERQTDYLFIYNDEVKRERGGFDKNQAKCGCQRTEHASKKEEHELLHGREPHHPFRD